MLTCARCITPDPYFLKKQRETSAYFYFLLTSLLPTPVEIISYLVIFIPAQQNCMQIYTAKSRKPHVSG